MRLAVFGLLAACTSTDYHFTYEHGGEATLHLEPVDGGDGIFVDTTLAGITQEDVELAPYDDCAAAHVTYVTDTATEEPLWGVLSLCAPRVEMSGACDEPADFQFELDGDPGSFFLSMDPLDNEPAGDQFWIDGELEVDDPMLGSTGHLAGTVMVTDGCMQHPVEHRIEVTWDFPLHSEVETSVKDDYGVPALAF